MNTNSFEVLEVLLKNYQEDAQGLIFKYFPKDEAKLLSGLKGKKNSKQEHFLPIEEKIATIHYSWFSTLVNKFPVDLLPYLLGALPKSYSKGLAEMSQNKLRQAICPAPVQQFLLNTIYYQLCEDKILTRQYLPESVLEPLLDLDKRTLVRLIDYLGLRDLAIALKQIVDKKALEKIFKLLTQPKQRYIKSCLQSKDPLTFKPQTMHKWTNNSENLMMLVHQRGLIRLSKAIAGQHSHFIWHLAHILDIGRGEKLLKLSRNKELGKYTAVLISQVLELIDLLQ